MNRFHVLEDAAVITRSKGVFRQCRLYRRGEELFAGHGSGFVRLMAQGHTSHPNVSWVDLDVAGAQTEKDRFGAPVLSSRSVPPLAISAQVEV